MAEIINLRTARKAKARKGAAVLADRNRAVFGRTGQEKSAAEADKERRRRLLDGAKIED